MSYWDKVIHGEDITVDITIMKPTTVVGLNNVIISGFDSEYNNCYACHACLFKGKDEFTIKYENIQYVVLSGECKTLLIDEPGSSTYYDNLCVALSCEFIRPDGDTMIVVDSTDDHSEIIEEIQFSAIRDGKPVEQIVDEIKLY